MYDLEGIEPVIIEKELIPDGTDSNYRIIKQRYFGSNFVVDEVFTYKHKAKDPAWLTIKKVEIVEADTSTMETFRTWNISNHPQQQNVTRTCNLVKLEVDNQEVRTLFLIKHSGNGNVEDQLIFRYDDDDNKFLFQGIEVGARTYWDILTEQGFTPYQLMDVRVPEMDALGIWDLIHDKDKK